MHLFFVLLIQQVAGQACTATIGLAPPTLCAGSTSASLAATFGGGATGGVWSGFSPGTMSNTTSRTATFTPDASQAGTVVQLVWTTSGACSPDGVAILSVTVPVPATVSIGVTSISPICGQDSTPALEATFGGSATGGVWSGWTNTLGNGAMSPSATTPNATFRPNFFSQSSTTVVLTWRSTGGCGNAFATVSVPVKARSFGGMLGPPGTVCVGVPTAPLVGTFSGTATGGKWIGYNQLGPGVMTPSDTDPMATFTAAPSQANSIFTITWQTTGGCTPDFMVQTSVTVVPFTNATAFIGAAPQTVCPLSATGSLNASYGGSAISGQWSGQGTGTISPNVNNQNAKFIPSLAQAGTVVTLTWTASSPCNLNAVATIPITVLPFPQAKAGTSATVLTNQATLNANAPQSGESGQWSVISGSGSFADSTLFNTGVTGLTLGANVFRWNLTTFCGSSVSQVTITYSNATTTTTTTSAPQSSTSSSTTRPSDGSMLAPSFCWLMSILVLLHLTA